MSSVVNELKEYIKSLNVLLECKANIADFIIKPIESNTYEFDGRRKRFHFVLKVVGTQYEGRADRIEDLSQGDTILIRREPENNYDPNCLAVLNSKGESLGTIGAEDAEMISPVIDDAGYTISNAFVSSVVPVSRQGAKAKTVDLLVSFELVPPGAKQNTIKNE